MKRPTGGAAAVLLIALLVLLPMFYVLSVGPVVWLHSRGLISKSHEPLIELVYSPLVWAAELTAPSSAALQWYAALWEQRVAMPTSPMPAYWTPSTTAPATLPAPGTDAAKPQSR